MEDGAEIQAYLFEKTGQRTVPNVFVSAYYPVTRYMHSTLNGPHQDGQHVGGMSQTFWK